MRGSPLYMISQNVPSGSNLSRLHKFLYVKKEKRHSIVSTMRLSVLQNFRSYAPLCEEGRMKTSRAVIVFMDKFDLHECF